MFIVFDENGTIVNQHQQELTQYLPNEVSVEHDPNEIWESVVNCINKVNKEFKIDQLDSIGITNQRETTLAWRKSTEEPLHNALVWQDTRTQGICDELKGMAELEDAFFKTAKKQTAAEKGAKTAARRRDEARFFKNKAEDAKFKKDHETIKTTGIDTGELDEFGNPKYFD